MSMTFKADVSGTFGTVQINGVDQIVIDNNGDVKSPAGLVMASGAGIVGDVSLGAVMETDSNANGWYIKFLDGTLICILVQTFTTSVNITSPSGGMYFADVTIGNYPHWFSAIPTISHCSVSGGAVTSSVPAGASATGCNLRFVCGISASAVPHYIKYIAIGRW